MNTKTGTIQTRKSMRIPASLLALTLVLGACGGSDSDTGFDDGSADYIDRGETSTDSDSYDAGGNYDAEEDFAPATTEVMEDEAVDEAEEADDGSGSLAKAPEGGFFEEEIAPEPDEEMDGQFADYGVRPFVDTSRDPLSTFALDVDTGSHSVGRQYLTNGQLPPAESVRVEEYVNSVDYGYDAPRSGLAMTAEGGPSPFDSNNVTIAIGVQAEDVSNSERPDASLVFVIDTSGSMDRDNRIGLVRRSLIQLVHELSDDDTVAIVTYSSGSRVLLEPTPVSDSDRIIDAIEGLETNGSTNLEAGLDRGYELARDAFVRDGINRVILASDGIANVGLTDADGLAAQIRDDADDGIHLLTVGVGMDGYNDVLMEQLADSGDGVYAYIDTDEEASELFGDQLVSTLLTVAIDAKIQVEFDDENVEAYRLIGFENRAVLDSDFRNDSVDAGELGAGHQVTAVYELTLADGLKDRSSLATVALRWQDPDSGDVIENRLEITGSIIENQWGDTTNDFRLAVVMASFAEILRDSPYASDLTMSQTLEEAEALADATGEGDELADMVQMAVSAG